MEGVPGLLQHRDPRKAPEPRQEGTVWLSSALPTSPWQ